MDWRKIRKEYIAGASQRQLSRKYGVSRSAISKHAVAEGWEELRSRKNAIEATKTVEKIAEQGADVKSRLYRIANKLLDQVEVAVDQLDCVVATKSEKVISGEGSEVSDRYEYIRDQHGGPVDHLGVMRLTTVIKDLKDVLDVKGNMDLAEQEARIAKLQHEAERDQLQNAPIEVSLEGVEHYAV